MNYGRQAQLYRCLFINYCGYYILLIECTLNLIYTTFNHYALWPI